ncbi:MAG: antitoxin Xre/MbcA/ParS toxin-binding domain-containing protein [Flavobacterium sp.]
MCAKSKPFNIAKKTIGEPTLYQVEAPHVLMVNESTLSWDTKIERVNIIRKGIPYTSIESISHKINRPIKMILSLLDMPQTTYNKKKNEEALLDARDGEIILLISELIDYGIMVFNNESEKFQRWLKKPNLSLGGYTPESFLDTSTGIEEVKNSLMRIEYGNFS